MCVFLGVWEFLIIKRNKFKLFNNAYIYTECQSALQEINA